MSGLFSATVALLLGVKENSGAGERNERWKKLGRLALMCGRWMTSPSTSSLDSKEAECDVTRGDGLAAGVIGDLVSSPREFVDLLLDVKGYSSTFFEAGEKNRLGRSVGELSVLWKKPGKHLPLFEAHDKQVHLFHYFVQKLQSAVMVYERKDWQEG